MAQRSIVPFLYGNSPALRSIPDPRALIERLFGEIPDLTGNTALAAPRIDVSETDRETLDMKAVRAKLSPQFITAHTNVTKVRALRVSARNGDVE